MNLEEKVNELETRIAKLEKIERDRRTRKIIMIVVKIVIYLMIIGSMLFLLSKLKVYYDQVTNLKDTFNLNGKSLDNFNLKDYNISDYFNSLFN